MLNLLFIIRFQVLATATDDKAKEETQNIKSGRRVTVSMLAPCSALLFEVVTISHIFRMKLNVVPVVRYIGARTGTGNIKNFFWVLYYGWKSSFLFPATRHFSASVGK